LPYVQAHLHDQSQGAREPRRGSNAVLSTGFVTSSVRPRSTSSRDPRRLPPDRSLPTEDAALVLLFGLVVSGQIRLRRLDGEIIKQ
jgi:hypothetical protein